MNFFPLLWYSALGGLGYFIYTRYISTSYLVNIWPYPLLNIYGVCSIYVIHELLVRIKQCVRVQDKPESVDTYDVCCIVPCHKTGLSLQKILPNLVHVFGRHNVYIADNGREPDVDTHQVCSNYGVHYRHYNIPNKTYALVQTAIHIEDTTNCKYVVLLDDDTMIDQCFYVRQDLLEQPLVAGYCCNITIDTPKNFWEKVIDFEYRTISYSNSLKPCIHFCHGIICVYHLRRMISIYSKLCTLPHGLPFGEDSFAGIDFRLGGYRLLHDDMNTIKTYCPSRFFSFGRRLQGFGASSIFKQRVLRWYLSWIRRVPQELALMLSYDTGTWCGNINYRLQLIWYFFIMVVGSSWVFFAIHVYLTKTYFEFGILHAVLYIVNCISAFIRFSGFNPQLRHGVSWYVPFLVPIMNVVVCLMLTTSFFITLLYYIPFVRINYQKTYSLFQK